MKIPVETRQVARPSAVNAPMQNPGVAGIASGARADLFGAIAKDAAVLGESIRRARVMAEVSARLAEAQKEHSAYWIERSSRPDDFKTLSADNDKFLGDLHQRVLASIDDAEGKAVLGERLQDYATRSQIQAMNTARDQEIRYSDRQMRLAMENSRMTMGATTDPAELGRMRAEIRAGLNAQIEAGVYSRPDADALWNDFVSGTQRDQLERLVQDDPYQAFRLLGSKEPIEGIDVSTRGTLLRAANAEISRREAERDERVRLVVKDAQEALKYGFRPPNLEAVVAAARGTKYEAELGQDVAILDASAAFARLRPDEQQQQIQQLRTADTLTGGQARFLSQIEKIHDEQQRELKTDPAGLAVRAGVVPRQSPLDLSDPDALAAGLQSAAVNFQIARDHYGEQAAPLLAADVTRLQDFMGRANADDRAAVLGVMADNLGPAMPAAMRQLYDKGNTLPALAGQIITEGDRDAARLMLSGQKVLEANKEVLPSGNDFKAGLQERLGAAYAASPAHGAAIMEGVKAAYAGLAQREGDLSGELDGKRLDKAVELVTGGLVEFGDDILQAPARGVDTDRFETWVDGLRPFDVDRMGGVAGFEDRAALELIRDKGRLVSAGNGRYMVVVPSLAGLPEPLKTHDGRLFLLDWNAKATHHGTPEVR